MEIAIVGAGPAGLFLACLLARDRAHRVTVLEAAAEDRDDTGLVLAPAVVRRIGAADPALGRALLRSAVRWEEVGVARPDGAVAFAGEPMLGVSRRRMCAAFQADAVAHGVRVHRGVRVDPASPVAVARDLLVGADGVHSAVRERHRRDFRPVVTPGRLAYVWATVDVRIPRFSFFFRRAFGDVFRVQAYPFSARSSSVVVEAEPAAWMAGAGELGSEQAVLRAVVPEPLAGADIVAVTRCRRFETVETASWTSARGATLVGDAAHAVHFSIGSGARNAVEDAISLGRALAGVARWDGETEAALRRHEHRRRRFLRAAQAAAARSTGWLERVDHLWGRPLDDVSRGLSGRAWRPRPAGGGARPAIGTASEA